MHSSHSADAVCQYVVTLYRPGISLARNTEYFRTLLYNKPITCVLLSRLFLQPIVVTGY